MESPILLGKVPCPGIAGCSSPNPVSSISLHSKRFQVGSIGNFAASHSDLCPAQREGSVLKKAMRFRLLDAKPQTCAARKPRGLRAGSGSFDEVDVETSKTDEPATRSEHSLEASATNEGRVSGALNMGRPKLRDDLRVGSPIVIVEAPPLLKTAEPMPMMRPNTGLIKPGDAGRVIDRRPKDVWAVRFAVGAYLIDRKYFKPLVLD